MTNTTTTFTKLRDGSWGIRGKNLTEGQQVTVTKKSGGSSVGTVGRVLFTADDGTSIARFEARRAVFASRYAASNRRSIGSGMGGCHTDGNCSSLCRPSSCPCSDGGGWFDCC